ncbi:hypothetical protein RRSWK_03129 [Rhodopirellula sp. SWK7]|nr:hypothetical protein RRSWK_03129 [Rhodopirellula sp. SWK7]
MNSDARANAKWPHQRPSSEHTFPDRRVARSEISVGTNGDSLDAKYVVASQANTTLTSPTKTRTNRLC